ncbi:probable methyltransferase TARBP1 isoform X2 [Neodiprion virginianus]|uniref:probable methyltransferase TARBP1 isoform X2 n=1 Tax=Neodiprion virginianus TaxID=2961670 RepID=UPI001EE6A128|nr:probable methyltransferase TARBP1 isoform X2 [Neodiprion virginianus]
MDVHERFMAHDTGQIKYLLFASTNHSYIFDSLLVSFSGIVQNINQHPDSLETLETLKRILCFVYQETRSLTEKNTDLVKLVHKSYLTAHSIDVDVLQKYLYLYTTDTKCLSLILDIFMLHMVLRYDTCMILKNLQHLQESIDEYFDTENRINVLDVKLMACYVNSLLLHPASSELSEQSDVANLTICFKRHIRQWLVSKNDNECPALILLLPKVISVTNRKEMLTEIWEMIFELKCDTGDILYIMCMTADAWFSIKPKYHEQLLEKLITQSFWLVLLKGLSSPIPHQRKQALYLAKRVVDFLDNYKIEEALEEKQKHFVIPVFPLLKTLVDEKFEQECCNAAGFHFAWVRCAFSRIFQHSNNTVVKWGLLNVFALDPGLYNDDFLMLILHVLNNTYLYENDTNDEPIIVKELIKLLNSAEVKYSDFVTRFLTHASKMTWGPVALFYIIHALSKVARVGSMWKEVELEAVKTLAEINLNMHCRVLRIGSQVELLETLTHFVTEPLNLVAVANTLSAFSIHESLTRGQLSWKRISTWLSKTVKRDEALRFLEKICSQFIDKNSLSDVSMKALSLMLMLFHDGHIILDCKSCAGFTMLRNLLHCLIGADSRPYGNIELRKRCIELIGYLFDFTSSKDYIMREFIADYVDITLRIAFKFMRNITDEATIDEINTLVLVTQKFFTDENSIISKRDVQNHIERFEVESWNMINDGGYSNNLQKICGIKILYACLKATNVKLRNYKFIGPLYNMYKTLAVRSSDHTNEIISENRNLEGKIVAEYYEFVAELFYIYLQDEPVDKWIPHIDWIEAVLHLVQVGGKKIFVPTIGILSQLFYKGVVKSKDIDRFKSVTRLCWKSMLETNECRLAMDKIMELIFSSKFLECEDMKELTMEFTEEMVEKVEKIPGLSVVLVNGLEHIEDVHLANFYDALLTCLFYGIVPRRDKKIELQARSYVFELYHKAYPNCLSNMYVNTDTATRAHAVALLHKRITDNTEHAAKLLPMIIARLNESQNKRYFGDSLTHRHKNRLIQALFVLQPVLKKNDMVLLNSLMCENILSESSQPSVRIMQEWLIIKIYLESEILRGGVWNLFRQAQEKRVGSLCSIISIVYHVARSLKSNLQSEFIDLSLEHMMPCCMLQQFNVRLYAQVLASKLYDLAKKMSYLAVTEKYKELYNSLTKSLQLGNLLKNSTKLQEDFYFTVFNPIDDYSLQTIFYELPRLSNVSSDEYILPQMFNKFGFKESNSHPLKIFNLKSDLSEASVSANMLKTFGNEGSTTRDDTNNISDYSTDIQKKFIPWKSMLPNEDELNETSGCLRSHREASIEGNKIILVASLVEKLPNLGGLSRTCEILGVAEFVMASLNHIEEKDFQSLSVSAEKLITLVEVKPHQLQQYLLEKKNMGYRLVGAEQTVNSTNLMEAKFEKKTVLVLGNEKAGIPANLIPLLDECVEIPQVGVVRSLNVHVTGAICLWECFKQHHSA